MDASTEVVKHLQDHLSKLLSSRSIQALDLNLITAIEKSILDCEQAIIFSTSPASLHSKLVCHLHEDITIPEFLDKMMKDKLEMMEVDDEVMTFFADIKDSTHLHHSPPHHPSHQPHSKFLGFMCCRVKSSASNDGDLNVKCFPIFHEDNIISVLALLCNGRLTQEQASFELLVKQYTGQHTNLRQMELERRKMQRQQDELIKLCGTLHEQDVKSMELKISEYMLQATHSEWGFLMLLDKEKQELFTHVVNGKVLDNEIRVSVKKNELQRLINQKQKLEPGNLMQYLPSCLLSKWPFEIHSHLILPLSDAPNTPVLAVILLFNKKMHASYTEEDERTLQQCFNITSPTIFSSIAVQNEIIIRKEKQVLLQVAKSLRTDSDDLTRSLRKIMYELRVLVKAERCRLHLLDNAANELVAMVIDEDGAILHKKGSQALKPEHHIPVSRGITGHVARSGQLLNTSISHHLFEREVDGIYGFNTRSLLCFPIQNDKGEVLGVAQLHNKLDGGVFSSTDEGIVQTFSVYFCISIMNSMLHRRAWEAQHHLNISNELMTYHMKVPQDEITVLMHTPCSLIPHQDFHSFSFIPRIIQVHTMPLAILNMMTDLGLNNTFRLHKETLIRFILMVKRGYRNPPYHNFSHAFAVVHFCFLLYKNTRVKEWLSDLEQLALFIACLCHDIDHRGTTNSFHIASGSSLAALYSSKGSVLESHHFAQTVCILNTKGCNIFEGLSRPDYRILLDLVQDIILATDIAQHLKKTPKMQKTFKMGFSPRSRDDKDLLLSLLMTSCDLSDQTKSFDNSKNIAGLIYTEFFSQGDLERGFGGHPSSMMDRHNARIPELQVGFLKQLALPVYNMLADLFPQTSEVSERLNDNCRLWAEMGRVGEDFHLPPFTFDPPDTPSNAIHLPNPTSTTTTTTTTTTTPSNTTNNTSNTCKLSTYCTIIYPISAATSSTYSISPTTLLPTTTLLAPTKDNSTTTTTSTTTHYKSTIF